MNQYTSNPDTKVSANLATQIIQPFSFFSIMASLLVSSRFGRKTLLQVGWFTLSILLGLIAYFMHLNNSKLTLIFIVMHPLIYNTTVGAVHQFYYAELLTDR